MMSQSNEQKIAIKVRNVDYVYTQRNWLKKTEYKALDGINLDIFKGETLGIQGKNGSGKSTLLKLLAGIYEPTHGKIERYGNRVSLQSLAAGFDVELNGNDNALIGAMLLGHSKSEARRKVDEINEFAELGDKFFEPVKTYSAGMRARLGFATAISMETDILLIDEVLGVGDKDFRVKASSVIKDKVKSELTVVIVSHSEKMLTDLCDEIFLL